MAAVRCISSNVTTWPGPTSLPGALGDVAQMHAADGIAAWRWWSLAELDSTAEVIWPAGLADLIRKVLAEERAG